MKTFSCSLEYTKSFDVSCQLRLHSSTCHYSTFKRMETGKHSDRQTSRWVLSLTLTKIYCSQKHVQAAVSVLTINGNTSSFVFQVFSFLPKIWVGINPGLIKNPIWLSHLKRDLIDLPVSFLVSISVKCRNSSFRWVDIGGKKNVARTV